MDVPVTHYHTCHTQSCLSNIIVNVILVPLLATVLWLWPLIAAVPGSKAMNRRRKLGLSALLRPLPYPLVPSFDAGWSQCDQIWKQPVMSKYPVFVSLLSFWDTILLCGYFFFDKIPEFSLRDFPDSWKEQRSSEFVRMSCPPLSVEFYQRRKGGFEKKICGSISPAAGAAGGGGGTSAKMLHLSFATRFAQSWTWEEFKSAVVLKWLLVRYISRQIITSWWLQ